VDVLDTIRAQPGNEETQGVVVSHQWQLYEARVVVYGVGVIVYKNRCNRKKDGILVLVIGSARRQWPGASRTKNRFSMSKCCRAQSARRVECGGRCVCLRIHR
jgi:hypothetical protein